MVGPVCDSWEERVTSTPEPSTPLRLSFVPWDLRSPPPVGRPYLFFIAGPTPLEKARLYTRVLKGLGL